MNIVLTDNLINQLNHTEEYRRQAELMYLKSYAVWLALRDKAVLSNVKKLA